MQAGSRMSLRMIFTLLNVGLLLAFGASVTWVTRAQLRESLRERVATRGVTLAGVLAKQAARDLGGPNPTEGAAAAVGIFRDQADVAEVRLTDDTGRVLARLAAFPSATAVGAGSVREFQAPFDWRDAPPPATTDATGAPVAPAVGPLRHGEAVVSVSDQALSDELARGLWKIVVLMLAGALVAGVIAFWFTGWVTRPLRDMVEYAAAMSRGDDPAVSQVVSRTQEVGDLADAFATLRQGLALVADQARRIAEGDLSQRVAGSGQLGAAFNAMVDSLSSLVGQIKKASLHIASATAEILAASRQAEKGSAEQASSINQTTTTMDELLSASKQIAVSADAVVKIAERTLGAAKAGEDAVQQSISGMGEIATNNRQTAERILELSERNQQIGNIVDLIDEIADKSDLLALNAAIEGAKAGEAGKGFAVVATEMRSLAENVVESTKEIKTLISEIQKASNASVLATEGQMKATDRGTQIALRTGDQLREILQMVVQTTEAAKQISLATQQQRTGTEQVVQSMSEIARIARTNVSGAGQTTASTRDLASLADDLKEAVSQFRLGP